jgi:hypothetical protein
MCPAAPQAINKISLDKISLDESTTSSLIDSVPKEELRSSSMYKYSLLVVAKGSSDGQSSQELRQISLLRKNAATLWPTLATPVRSNGRSHPLEIRSRPNPLVPRSRRR